MEPVIHIAIVLLGLGAFVAALLKNA